MDVLDNEVEKARGAKVCKASAYKVVAYIVMAYVDMACIVLAHIVVACIDMTYVVAACIGMAYVVMACVIMAYIVIQGSCWIFSVASVLGSMPHALQSHHWAPGASLTCTPPACRVSVTRWRAWSEWWPGLRR